MSKRARRWAILLAVLALSVVSAWKFWPREPLLLQRATKVANAEEWFRHYDWSLGYHWLSDHEVLHQRITGNPNNPQRTIYRLDTLTGADTIQPALTKLLNAFEEDRVESEVSPNGRWLLCSGRFGETLLVEINTGQHYNYPGGGYKHIQWMTDSRHWIEQEGYNEEDTLSFRDVENPTTSREQKLPKNSLLNDYRMGYIQTANRALVFQVPDDSDKTKRVEFIWCRLSDNGKPEQKFTVSLPDGARCRDICIFPNGDRVAWEFHIAQKSSWRTWLHRLIPRVKAEPQQTSAIWVSKLDGSEMHEVGHILSDKEDEDGYFTFDLKWLPGGKRLSFVYKDALYTVPAD